MDPYHLPTGTAVPRIVNAVVEMPKDTRNRVEYSINIYKELEDKDTAVQGHGPNR